MESETATAKRCEKEELERGDAKRVKFSDALMCPTEEKERQQAVEEWICSVDRALLFDEKNQRAEYGWGGQKIGKYVCEVMAVDCARYYETNANAEKYLQADTVLCQGVCPLFILHGLRNLLASQLHKNCCYGSYEMQMGLHCLKCKLECAGADVGRFLTRLFELVYWREYGERKFPPVTPECFQIAIACFFFTNIPFLRCVEYPIARTSADPHDPSVKQCFELERHYKLATEDIKEPRGMRWVIFPVLFPEEQLNWPEESVKQVCSLVLSHTIKKWDSFFFQRSALGAEGASFPLKPTELRIKAKSTYTFFDGPCAVESSGLSLV